MYYWAYTVPEDPSATLLIGRAFPKVEVSVLDRDGPLRDGHVVARPGASGALYVVLAVAAGSSINPNEVGAT